MFPCLAFFFQERIVIAWLMYKVVSSFPSAFVLFGAAYIFYFASICGVKSRVAFIRVITVYEFTTCFSELSRMYISVSTDILFFTVVLVSK